MRRQQLDEADPGTRVSADGMSRAHDQLVDVARPIDGHDLQDLPEVRLGQLDLRSTRLKVVTEILYVNGNPLTVVNCSPSHARMLAHVGSKSLMTGSLCSGGGLR